MTLRTALRWISILVPVLVVGCLTSSQQGYVPLEIAMVGLVLTWRVSIRLTTDPVCRRLIIGSYLLKILLTVVLYYASLYGWPIFRKNQGNGGGFWEFADDAQGYHNMGSKLLAAWHGSGPFPFISYSNWSFIIYVALVYQAFGIHPLNISLLNAWYGTIITCAGLTILRRWQVPASSLRFGVGLLAFWPSLLLWSSQTLKDPLTLALSMLILTLLTLFFAEGRIEGRWVLLRLTALLGFLLFLLSLLRRYAGLALMVTTLTVCSVVAIQGWRKRQHVAVGQLLTIAIIAVLSVLSASSIDLRKFAQPPLSSSIQPDLEQKPQYNPEAGASPQATISNATNASAPFPAVRHDQENPSTSLIPNVSPSPSTSAEGAEGRHEQSAITRGGSILFSALPHSIQDVLISVRPDKLNGLRVGFTSTGGYSAIDACKSFDNPIDMLRYVPRGLWILFLAPFPSQWFDVGGRTGIFRCLAGVEALLTYLLGIGFLLSILLNTQEIKKRHGIELAPITCFSLLLAILMSWTVANLGTLFRLRLQVLIPLLVLMCAADIMGGYRQALQRFRRWMTPNRGCHDDKAGLIQPRLGGVEKSHAELRDTSAQRVA